MRLHDSENLLHQHLYLEKNIEIMLIQIDSMNTIFEEIINYFYQ